MRQMATRRIEGDAGKHCGIHHLRARLAVRCVRNRARQEFSDETEGFPGEQVGKRIGSLRYRSIDPLGRVHPPRIRACGDRFERVAHAVKAGGGNDLAR